MLSSARFKKAAVGVDGEKQRASSLAASVWFRCQAAPWAWWTQLVLMSPCGPSAKCQWARARSGQWATADQICIQRLLNRVNA